MYQSLTLVRLRFVQVDSSRDVLKTDSALKLLIKTIGWTAFQDKET